MAETYRYLIEYISNLRGIDQAKRGIKSLEAYNTKFGAQVGKVTRVLSKHIDTSSKKMASGATQNTRTITRVFQTASGQAHKYTRAVTTANGKVIKSQEKLAKTTIKAGQATKGLMASQAGLAMRAMAVIPIWMALRAAMMLIIGTVRLLITTFIDLDEGMARIKTVMQGTAESIRKETENIRSYILNMSMKTRVPIKELAEAFYFLKTSNLSTKEAMAGFIPVINAMVGTGNKAKDTARAIAGMYNTMGKYLGENLTITEKFTKIADTLTYTYATQDVQLEELIQSYMKMAPYLSGLDDDFEDIVTTLGFLNTRLLRAGRTGRLTGRAILQLTKNAKKLAERLGVTFDPKQPISFLKVMDDIYNKIGITGKLTAEQGQILQEVFATRGAVPIRLLLDNFKEWMEAVKKGRENISGFNKRMAEIKLDTITGQMQRFKNLLFVTVETFVTAITGTNSLKEALKKLNDKLGDSQIYVGGLATDIATLIHNFNVLRETSGPFGIPKFIELLKIQKEFDALEKELNVAIKNKRSWEKQMSKTGFKGRDIINLDEYKNLNKEIGRINKRMQELNKEIEKRVFKKPSEELDKWAQEYVNVKKRTSELLGELDKVNKSEEDREKIQKEILKNIKIEKQEMAFLIGRLKVMGISELEIAKIKLTYIESLKEQGRLEENSVELLKARHSFAIASLKEQDNLWKKLSSFRLNMLKTVTASELYLIEVQKRELEARKAQFSPLEYQNKILDLQLEKEIALQRQIAKRKDLYKTVMEKILSSTDKERDRLEKVITTLLPLEGNKFVVAFRGLNKELQTTAISIKSLFTPEQQRALIRARILEAGIGMKRVAEKIEIAIKEMPEIDTQLIRASELYVDKLRMGEDVKKAISEAIGYQMMTTGKYYTTPEGERIPYAERVPITEEMMKTPSPVDLHFQQSMMVNINLPRGTFAEIAEMSGKALSEKLKDNPEFKRLFSNLFWQENGKGAR